MEDIDVVEVLLEELPRARKLLGRIGTVAAAVGRGNIVVVASPCRVVVDAAVAGVVGAGGALALAGPLAGQ